ncbi:MULTISPECIES: peptide ABC transporter substrate-binding protein [Clostridium]|jgi:ABC-type oligopeptide transport system, periplasmic component|uniref:Peptide ABC transporter substrate-binding protein n=2 Tax=Clostridium beijerinckii TaxID=1520 RepID=A0AAE2RN37_CLOBE|nr:MULTISPECIES: peptide ABC transporter substrate-binding protein [Clostridium]ABR37034.1 extracellular solute-binding protein, family 5 [Clostridium beijerinckii NCIMB 8052]AIU02236.1 extracellular solute-binding protein [Clostridium beijerinckii ATCC 35702]MBF7808318.1 peptide ABC transporter substrate-binding protein [Clostridium beijerinckii]NRT21886.1 oligopeptide transport system substrate-binding protein [Clostridium beijerinckii]NRT65608.1 oligopeptide transport system substrate-bindi
MKTSKVKQLCAVALAATLGMSILVGCGSNKGGDKAAASKQEITYNLGADPRTLDPALCTDTTGTTVIANAFSGLAELDENEKAIPGQAEWEVSNDKLTYTFHLKKDLKWSNGDPVKASDYEYEWKRLLNPETASEYAYALYYLKGGEAYNKGKGSADAVGVKATDDNTLVVTLEAPCPYFLELTAQSYYFPVDQKVVESNKDWANDAKTLVSNGPFKITNYTIKDSVVLEKNENYYDKDKVKLDKLNLKFVAEETSAWASYKSGQFDVVDTVPKSDVQGALKDGSAKSFPNLATYFLSINVSDKAKAVDPNAAKVLSDPKVRKALNLAIDRQSIVDNVTKAGQIPAHGIVGKGIIGPDGKDYTEKTTYFDPKGNVEEAKKLLAEAGYPDGQGLPTLQLLYNPESGHGDTMQAIQDMWKKIGVNAELQSQEWKVFLTTRVQKQFELARDGWNADYVDPMTFLDMFQSTSDQNNCGYNNPSYDALIDAAKKELDPQKRFDIMHQAEDMLMNDMPVIPLYYYTRTIGIKDYVKGARVSVMNTIYFKNAYVEGKK